MALPSTKSSFLFVLFLCLLGSVSSLAIRETNADRMARGLSPLSPANLRRASGTDTARRGIVSPTPPTTETGRLQVRYQSGSGNAGYVRNWSGGAPISGVSFLGGDEELRVSLTYTPSSPTQLNILATNPKFPAPYYVGAAGGLNKYESSSGNVMSFTNVDQTQPGSIPTKPGTSSSYVESAIWTFDPSTKKLEATWINGDGSVFKPVLAYAVRENSLFFVGSPQQWMNEHPNYFISAVDLYLVN